MNNMVKESSDVVEEIDPTCWITLNHSRNKISLNYHLIISTLTPSEESCHFYKVVFNVF
jgi:hypothetical protein